MSRLPKRESVEAAQPGVRTARPTTYEVKPRTLRLSSHTDWMLRELAARSGQNLNAAVLFAIEMEWRRVFVLPRTLTVRALAREIVEIVSERSKDYVYETARRVLEVTREALRATK